MTDRRNEFLSVVIPAYNEERRLPASLPAIHGYLSSRFDRFEIIVVDDGSTDGTAALVKWFAGTAPHVRLLTVTPNRGKGHAVRHGMLAAGGDVVLFSDADLSTPIEEVEGMLDLIARDAQVVVASRALPGSDIQVRQRFLRQRMGEVFNLLVRALVGLPFVDTQCGFKCFTRPVAQAVFGRARIDGFAFDVEALLLARRLGFRTVDVPVRWVNSPESRVTMFRHSAQMLVDLLRIRVHEARGAYR
jgi:dolichyl-phosphate beta-glucosyltransferase